MQILCFRLAISFLVQGEAVEKELEASRDLCNCQCFSTKTTTQYALGLWNRGRTKIAEQLGFFDFKYLILITALFFDFAIVYGISWLLKFDQ